MSLSFVVFMGGAQISVNEGIKEAVTSFFQSDIIVISGGAPLEREFWKKLVRLDNGTLIEKAAPVRIIGTKLRGLAPNVVVWKNVWRTFRVIGIARQGAEATQMNPLSKMCYISYHTLNLQWGYYEDEASMFYLKVNLGYREDIGYVRDRILNKFGKRYGIGVISRVDVLDAVRGWIQQI